MAEKKSAKRTKPTRTPDPALSLFNGELKNAKALREDDPTLNDRKLKKLEGMGLPFYRVKGTTRKFYRPPEVLALYLEHGVQRNQPRKRKAG